MHCWTLFCKQGVSKFLPYVCMYVSTGCGINCQHIPSSDTACAVNFYASTTNNRWWEESGLQFIHLAVYLSVVRPFCPSVNTYFVCDDISLLSGEISMKLDTNIHHASGNCWQGFQGQRSKVKVMAKWNALFLHMDTHQLTAVHPLSVQQRHTSQRCGIEAKLYCI